MEKPRFKFEQSQEASKKRNVLLTDAAEKILNFRIEQEEFSSWLYLAMSQWLDNQGFVNISKEYKKYSDEERSHAQWAREYLLAMGVTPNTPALKQPQNNYSSLLEILLQTYDHENLVTTQCNVLCSTAMKGNDFLLLQLGQKYMGEQIEEIERTRTNLDRYYIAEREGNIFLFEQSFA